VRPRILTTLTKAKFSAAVSLIIDEGNPGGRLVVFEVPVETLVEGLVVFEVPELVEKLVGSKMSTQYST